MKPLDAARTRALSILVIVACLALGTLTVIQRTSDMWPWFAAVFYGIAVINMAVEVLLSRRASRLRRGPEEKERQSASEGKDSDSPDH